MNEPLSHAVHSTFVMFPALVWVYARLARREERDALTRFGEAYGAYAARVPAFLPRLSRRAPPLAPGDAPRATRVPNLHPHRSG